MKVLVCGASGFIGKALCERLERDGHDVVRGFRGAPEAPGSLAMDFSADLEAATWCARLRGFDAVINAVGILAERRGQSFDAIHHRAAVALFAGCAAAGVRHVVQVSALGAASRLTPYFASKHDADTFLTTLPLDWHIVRPGLVYGHDGSSARFFRMLASLPVHVLPAGGRQRLQPVHIEDLADAVAALLSASAPPSGCIDVVGPRPVTLREMLAAYRAGMGFAPACAIAVPAPLVDLAARLGGAAGTMLTQDTWSMLRAGNTADAGTLAALLGRHPVALPDFTRVDAGARRQEALAGWRTAVMRLSLAVTWIWTAIVSAWLYPLQDSLALLARVGITGPVACAALYGAAALDLALGLATWLRPGRRLWLAQAALVAGYTAIVAVALPETLIHPFGPILKNLPILGILLILFSEETQP